MNNPFSMSFGLEPIHMISRANSQAEVCNTFLTDTPSSQVYMLTGVRGSGKTVMLSEIANEFRGREEWTVIDLNSSRDMLQTMAAELISARSLKTYLGDIKLSLNIQNFGVEISDSKNGLSEITVVLNELLEKITSKGKKVLLTVDEVVTNKSMIEFASQFQIFIRKKFNVFLVMAGLYENINKLQNEKTLTFLYRAPRIELPPLNLYLIQKKYEEVFDVNDATAKAMANVTKGYPYAFQALGYLCFQNRVTWEKVLPEYDVMLEDYCYEKIWSEMSEKDKLIVGVMAKYGFNKVDKLREKLNMTSNEFTVYRKRLIKKGIVAGRTYGVVEFTLPRFGEFVNRNFDVDEEIY